jgi:hypothetical protein
MPGFVKLVSFITTIALVLVFYSSLAGKADADGSTTTNPKMQNISMVWLALYGTTRPHSFCLLSRVLSYWF